MLKKFVSLVVSIIILSFGFSLALADENFNVDTTVTYEVADSGKTLVTHDITLENAFSTLYATSYTLQLENIDVQNIKAYEFNQKGERVDLEVAETEDSDKVNAAITFKEAVVGKGSRRHFFVTYENSSFVVRTGEVWEVTIPKLADASSFRNYTAILKVPTSLGQEAYLSPNPVGSTSDSGNNVYTFDKNSLTKTGVTAGFGQFQVFTFTLNYHLENPLAISTETGIAVPPDTSFQKIYIHSINPQPSNVIVDPDGNYIANFKLSSRQRVDVVVSGEVQIFSSQRPFPKPTEEVLANNLKETTFWQVNDSKIKELALKLKTPKEIYNFVTTTLKYDYERVAPNEQRMGAVSALANPDQAICMEFTDLFIAIARAAGIPAREINGYAYTENPQIQPLSLVADVLHSWPEYYDKEKGAWIPIDPTWGSTTGGVDFFDKLDLRHFTFVIHGADDTKPYAPGSYKLGSNPQKDVYVSFGKLSSQTTSFPEISASFKPSFPFFPSILSLTVKNPQL